MPIVNITMVAGRDEARKANMVAAVTEAIAHTLDTPREAVRIIINEVAPWHFAVGGVLKGAAPSEAEAEKP
jgi:4-oxalocrotonate tautomerase